MSLVSLRVTYTRITGICLKLIKFPEARLVAPSPKVDFSINFLITHADSFHIVFIPTVLQADSSKNKCAYLLANLLFAFVKWF